MLSAALPPPGARIPCEGLDPVIEEDEVSRILAEFRRLRTTDEQIYLRIGSLNRINGRIGMTFSCDGSHYIDHRTFFEKLDTFVTSAEGTTTPCNADQSGARPDATGE